MFLVRRRADASGAGRRAPLSRRSSPAITWGSWRSRPPSTPLCGRSSSRRAGWPARGGPSWDARCIRRHDCPGRQWWPGSTGPRPDHERTRDGHTPSSLMRPDRGACRRAYLSKKVLCVQTRAAAPGRALPQPYTRRALGRESRRFELMTCLLPVRPVSCESGPRARTRRVRCSPRFWRAVCRTREG